MNITRPWPIIFLFLLIPTLYTGCTEEEPVISEQGNYEYVPPGKADNYRSTTGLEFVLLAFDQIVLPSMYMNLTGVEREAKARELVALRFKALSYFIYAYVASKSSHDENADYGGFRASIRQQTFEELLMEEDQDQPGTFDFLFEAECAGPNDLLSTLPLRSDNTFALIMPKLTSEELEDMSYTRTYRHFDPANFDSSQLMTLMIEISPNPSEPDAYPEYLKMFEDGTLDVAIHIGGDYNDSRYDLSTAADLFERLQSDLGLTPPVATFAELTTDSGPFTGILDSMGQEIKIEVYLIHPDMNKEEGVGYDGLIELYKQSAATRDIVIYDGHAGYDTTYSGVVVHYNPRHAIAADDFKNLELPEKYQLFVFNGCKTYTAYADSIYANPNKTTANMDVITTVNFSWLSEMTRVTSDLLGHFLATEDNTHHPRSYDQILVEMNKGRSWDVIYGIHGLSDNPHRSPYADEASLCGICDSNDQCPGIDNFCLGLLGGQRGCTYACTHNNGCPEGYSCRPTALTESELISGHQCVPTSGSCQ